MEAPHTSDRHRDWITASSDVDPSDSCNLHRDLLTDRTAGSGPPQDRGALDQGIAIVHLAEASSDGVEDSWKNTTIAVRSNRNRGAIEPRSWILHRGIDSTILRRHSMVDRDHDQPTIVAQSWPDRSAIVARSWCDRSFF